MSLIIKLLDMKLERTCTCNTKAEQVRGSRGARASAVRGILLHSRYLGPMHIKDTNQRAGLQYSLLELVNAKASENLDSTRNQINYSPGSCRVAFYPQTTGAQEMT